ncbi:unnamed protein product [Pylaiella littoralis]
MSNCNHPRLAFYAALALPLLLRCSGFTMTAVPKGPPASSSSSSSSSSSRAGFLKSVAIGILGAGVGTSAASIGRPMVEAAEAAAEPLVETYWGNGCFWHVQHEMIKAEQAILGRSTEELTSYAGYGGAKRNFQGDKLCYHNIRGIGDYGKAGAGEVVSVKIPPSKVPEFAKAYFDMFVTYDNGAGRVFLDRRDTQDRGGEYRSLLGVPGGLSGPMAGPIKEEAAKRGLALREGSGGDPDTLMRNTVFVMDTAAFPFFKGETYHQFHNDMTEDYGRKYNNLRKQYRERERELTSSIFQKHSLLASVCLLASCVCRSPSFSLS